MCQILTPDSPTYSRQFDTNCGKIQYVSDPSLIVFESKYKCKISSYMAKTRVLLISRPNLGFNLNYFSFLL